MTENEAIEKLREKYMDSEYYFAENDEYEEDFDEDLHKAYEIAISALKEIQQYRVLGLEKLAKYEDLEEQGLLLKLPNDFKKWCDKIGDYIWFVNGGDIYPVLVIGIGFDGDMNFVISTIDDNKDGAGLSYEFKLEDLNKIVFLTQTEALKGMERDESEEERE